MGYGRPVRVQATNPTDSFVIALQLNSEVSGLPRPRGSSKVVLLERLCGTFFSTFLTHL